MNAIREVLHVVRLLSVEFINSYTTTTKLYPTKWGQLDEKNDVLMFYRKPLFGFSAMLD